MAPPPMGKSKTSAAAPSKGTSAAVTSKAAAGTADEAWTTIGWDQSTITPLDFRKLRNLDVFGNAKFKRPGDESTPAPEDGWRVMFFAFMVRGISLPLHEFLRGLLFVYGIQLWQLTPNSILHIACFITLCESFLCILPHLALWKRMYPIRPNLSKNTIHDVGGVIISVNPDVSYFNFQLTESAQGWRKKWFYIKDQKVGSQLYGLAPFDAAKKIMRTRAWDHEISEEEVQETEPMMKRIQELKAKSGKDLSGLQIIAHFLRLRILPCQNRQTAMWQYTGTNDASRTSSEQLDEEALAKIVRSFTKLTKNDSVPMDCRFPPYSAANALPKNHACTHCYPPVPEGGATSECEPASRDFINDAHDEDKETEEVSSSESKSLPAASSDDRYANTELTPPRRKRNANEMGGEVTSADRPRAQLVTPLASAFPEDDTGKLRASRLVLDLSSDSEGTGESPKPSPAAVEKPDVVISEDTPKSTTKVDDPPEPQASKPVPNPAEPPAAKKRKTGAGEKQPQKAITFSEARPEPPMDDPLMREFIDMGWRSVKYHDECSVAESARRIAVKERDEALERAKVAEQKVKELEENLRTSIKTCDDALKRTKAAETALEEAQKKATSEERRLRERDEELAARVKTLDNYVAKFTEADITLTPEEIVDPLSDTITRLEANSTRTCDLFGRVRRVLGRLYPELFPHTMGTPAGLPALIDAFNDKENPLVAYGHSHQRVGADLSVGMVMASGADVDWEKVSSPPPATEAGVAIDLRPHLKKAKKYTEQIIKHALALVTAAAERKKAWSTSSASVAPK